MGKTKVTLTFAHKGNKPVDEEALAVLMEKLRKLASVDTKITVGSTDLYLETIDIDYLYAPPRPANWVTIDEAAAATASGIASICPAHKPREE